MHKTLSPCHYQVHVTVLASPIAKFHRFIALFSKKTIASLSADCRCLGRYALQYCTTATL